MTYEKLEKVHKEIMGETKQEGIVSDYVMFQGIKYFFNIPNLSFYDFGIVKQTIERTLQQRGYKV